MKNSTLKFKGGKKSLLVDQYGRQITAFSDVYGYRSAEEDRLNQGFTTRCFSPGNLISLAARKLRARAQDLERDSDYTRRFLSLMENNIVGWRGFRLQSEATRSIGGDAADRLAIRLIEDRFTEWSESPFTTLDQSSDLVDLTKMIVRRRIIDGEVFVEMIPGADNPFRFAVRLHDPDDIPIGFTDPKRNIYFGIRYSADWVPVGYFVNTGGGGVYAGAYRESDLREIPAHRIFHFFKPERPEQRRGISEISSTAERLYMLSKFEQATLVGAQIASAKMGFFRDPDDESLAPMQGTDSIGEGDQEQLIIDIEAGQFQDIGNKDFKPFDVEYPPAGYDEYTKSLIREVASGLGISYHLLANDPGSVNYSTAREFKLQDVEVFRGEQQRMIRRILTPMADEWLRIQILTPEFSRYAMSDFPRLKSRRWQTRGWDWVDPAKEAQANKLQIEMRIKTPSMVCADKGLDFEEVCEQWSRDKEIAERHGIDLEALVTAKPPEPPEGPPPPPDGD